MTSLKYSGRFAFDPSRRGRIAIAVAGVLAEAGVRSVTLQRRDGSLHLSARGADLPAQLLPPHEALSWPGGTIRIDDGVMSWSVDDPDLHIQMPTLGD